MTLIYTEAEVKEMIRSHTEKTYGWNGKVRLMERYKDGSGEGEVSDISYYVEVKQQ